MNTSHGELSGEHITQAALNARVRARDWGGIGTNRPARSLDGQGFDRRRVGPPAATRILVFGWLVELERSPFLLTSVPLYRLQRDARGLRKAEAGDRYGTTTSSDVRTVPSGPAEATEMSSRVQRIQKEWCQGSESSPASG